MELSKYWHYFLLAITCGTVFMNAGKYFKPIRVHSYWSIKCSGGKKNMHDLFI